MSSRSCFHSSLYSCKSIPFRQNEIQISYLVLVCLPSIMLFTGLFLFLQQVTCGHTLKLFVILLLSPWNGSLRSSLGQSFLIIQISTKTHLSETTCANMRPFYFHFNNTVLLSCFIFYKSPFEISRWIPSFFVNFFHFCPTNNNINLTKASIKFSTSLSFIGTQHWTFCRSFSRNGEESCVMAYGFNPSSYKNNEGTFP